VAKDFTLEDFARQLQQAKRLTSPDHLSYVLDYFRENREETVARLERIIAAMEPSERKNPEMIGASNIQRIASRSGLTSEEIQQFLQQFARLRKRMQMLAGLSWWQRLLFVFGRRRLPEES
jgi:signal recognition particle GTPase